MRRSTKRRVPALQICPELLKTAMAAPGTAAARSASAKTTSGDFPPSSSDTRLRLPAEARMISWPVRCEPVKATLSTSGWAARAAPAVSPYPGTMLTTPSGTIGLQEEFPKAQRRQRGFFGWLEHHRTSGGQGWSHFPHGCTQWAVPWDDGADDPHRLFERVRDILARQGVLD